MELWETVSLLLAEGHVHAKRYPVAMAWLEGRIVTARINQRLASEAILIQSAIISALSEDGAKQFTREIERLTRR